MVFIVAGILLVGFGYASIAYGTGAQEYLSGHSNMLLILAGLLVTAVGVGSASSATYRHGELERPDRRLIDRLTAILFILPIGAALLGWGLLKIFAPSVTDRASAAIKSAALQILDSLVN